MSVTVDGRYHSPRREGFEQNQFFDLENSDKNRFHVRSYHTFHLFQGQGDEIGFKIKVEEY